MISTIISSFQISDIFYLLIALKVIYITQFYYHYFTRPNPLPGPIPLPFLGNILNKIGFEYKDWLMSMHKKYGDMYEITLGGQRMIILSRADLIENMNIPSTKTKYPFRNLITEGMAEYGISEVGVVNNIEPKSWKYHRQFFTQAMMTPSFNNQAIEWTIELWEKMESHWNNLGENQEINFTKWMRRFTNDMIFRISTGVKNDAVTSYYNTLILEKDNSLLSEKEKEKIVKTEYFIKSIETYTGGFMLFVAFNKFIRSYIPLIRGKVNSLLKNKEYLFDRLYNIIKQRRIEIENTPLDQPLRHDMLTSFITANTSRDINATKNADAELLKPMTDKKIFGNLLDAMVGGTDTTSNMLCFIAYYLGHYPEVKQKLQQELEEVLGKDLTKPITSKDLDELKYCDAVIKEVFRHFPVAFVIGRVNVKDDMIGGYNWSEGTSFQILISAVIKHKDYWTDPEKFDPDRFYKIEESNKYLLEKQHAKNSFIMWGGGIRMCPGRKLAMIELKCLLASIYRKYDIELTDMNAPLKYKADFLASSDELLVKVKPRKF